MVFVAHGRKKPDSSRRNKIPKSSTPTNRGGAMTFQKRRIESHKIMIGRYESDNKHLLESRNKLKDDGKKMWNFENQDAIDDARKLIDEQITNNNDAIEQLKFDIKHVIPITNQRG